VNVVLASAELARVKVLVDSLAADAGFAVRHCASSAREILFCCEMVNPCVLIVDHAFFREVDKGEFQRKAGYGRNIAALTVLTETGNGAMEELLRLGCMGFVDPCVTPACLQKAIRCVAGGEVWAGRRLISDLLRRCLSVSTPRLLTAREEEILSLMARGYRNREIARTLCITRETVRWHQRNLYSKMGVHDRASAAVIARKSPLEEETTLPAEVVLGVCV